MGVRDLHILRGEDSIGFWYGAHVELILWWRVRDDPFAGDGCLLAGFLCCCEVFPILCRHDVGGFKLGTKEAKGYRLAPTLELDMYIYISISEEFEVVEWGEAPSGMAPALPRVCVYFVKA